VSWIPVPEGSPFPLANLPLGVGHPGDGRWRAWVAVGDAALDLAGAQEAGALTGLDLPAVCFARPTLNDFLASGPAAWAALRTRLHEVLDDDTHAAPLRRHVLPRSSLTMGVPVAPVDFVDFYSSLHHAENLGRLFRPDGAALLPNWRRIPVAYHGRTGTLVPDGAEIPRPHGYRLDDGEPRVGPSGSLDVELEVGTVVGVGSERGRPVPIAHAAHHLYGICLVNDWSARDLQSFEYQPLGPFLGKSFATSVSPWLVSFAALEPFRVTPPRQDPPPAAYLRTDEPWAFDLHLEVWLASEAMRDAGEAPVRITHASFADMYWTPAQQFAHLTVNGAGTAPGDLFASGTVSGPRPGTEGSLIELTGGGSRPIDLPDGTTRTFLRDGDRVELRGWAGADPATRIGLGSVAGTVVTSDVVRPDPSDGVGLRAVESTGGT
jgi:fumarylacetoacetase